MPIHVFRIHRAVASILLVMLAIAAFHSTLEARPVSTGETASATGGANTCTVQSCNQCGETCTGGYDKNGSCLGRTCNRCTITSTTACAATCTVTSCGQCGQTCVAGFDKAGACRGWACNQCTVSDASCGRACPASIPAIVDAFDAQCLTAAGNARCPSEISQTVCTALTTNATRLGLLTTDGASYLRGRGYCPILRPDAGAILGFCPAGCFSGETQILTAMADDGVPGYTQVSRVLPDGTVLAASDSSGVDAMALVSRTVGRIVSGPEAPPLVVLALSTGATLRVTSHHPMVLNTGAVVEAAGIVRGAKFIGVDGRTVAVVAVANEPATTDVFNFETTGTSQLSHVVVAEGVLVGDLKLQNELAAEQHSIELRN